MITESRRKPRRSRRRSRRLLPLWASLLIAIGVAVGRQLAPPPAAPAPAVAGRTSGLVEKVVDGDTIKLADGTSVRYIGVDTPEVRRRKGGGWVRDPEPFAEAATEANRVLVEGRNVELEADVEPHDRYGRKLAYVYVDGEMVNERLMRDGMAVLMTIPPNVKYIERFRAAQQEARAAKRGLWAARTSNGGD